MKKILAIGGAVIKTARDELYELIQKGEVEMLIHNGGSLFHDFQRPTDTNLKGHSYSIDELLKDMKCNEPTAKLVCSWLWTKTRVHGESREHITPNGSVTRLCEDMDIPVRLFTTPGADFWHLWCDAWEDLAAQSWLSFMHLKLRFEEDNFHFVNMGSAVMHPEIFIKAIAVTQPQNFKADVVDFLDMYRPRTRVARFGTYYKMTHVDYLSGLLKGDIE